VLVLLLMYFGQLEVQEPVDPDDTLPYRIEKRGADLSKFAKRLSAGNQISYLFPQAPQKGQLHIIVKVPSSGEYGSSVLVVRC
jgi:hypothetical protein